PTWRPRTRAPSPRARRGGARARARRARSRRQRRRPRRSASYDRAPGIGARIERVAEPEGVHRAHRLQSIADGHAKRAHGETLATGRGRGLCGAHEVMAHNAEVPRVNRAGPPHEPPEIGDDPGREESPKACGDMCGTTERGASAVQAERRAAEAVEELCKKTHLVRPIAAVERHERDARAPAHGEPLHESAARRMPEIPFPAGERGIARALGNARPELVRPDPL